MINLWLEELWFFLKVINIKILNVEIKRNLFMSLLIRFRMGDCFLYVVIVIIVNGYYVFIFCLFYFF